MSKRDKAWLADLIEFFGSGRPLGAITAGVIDEAVRALCPAGGPAHVNRSVLTPIAAVLHHAAEKGWIELPG
jgi:hypothetical protein